MGLIILSSILFGLVHPGSKALLSEGIGLIDFCLLYVGIRLFIQTPFYLFNLRQNNLFQIKQKWHILLFFGFVGAALQLSEFFGLSKGLPVSTVTFLVYSHPIWSLILSYFINKEMIGINEILRSIVGIIGIYFISTQANTNIIELNHKIISPIFAGFLIALWSSLSNKLRKSGISSFSVSYFYDLFAFIALLIFSIHEAPLQTHYIQIINWIKVTSNLWSICVFSIFIGLLPNYLFYLGSGFSSNINASLLLLIEPIIATIVAFVWMSEPITLRLIVGAILILISGVSLINFIRFLKRFAFFLNKSMIIYFFILLIFPVSAFAKKILLIEISPQNDMDYTVSEELKLIESSSELAFNKAKKTFPKCQLDMIKHIESGTEEDLYKIISEKNLPSSTSAVVGLSRSTFARIGSKALQNKNVLGISIGASSAKLYELNSKFYSIASELKNQIISIHDKTLKLKCKDTIGFFDSTDSLSSEYKNKYLEIFKEKNSVINITPTSRLEKINSSCVFIGMNFSKSIEIIRQLLGMNVSHVFGTGDWSIHSTELKKYLNESLSINGNTKIYSPTGWLNNQNKNSLMYSKSIKEVYNLNPNPIGAYAYDSILITSEYLCENMPLKNIILKGKVKPLLLRNYIGISESQNFISKMNIISYGDRP